jgi:hypothetical protein
MEYVDRCAYFGLHICYILDHFVVIWYVDYRFGMLITDLVCWLPIWYVDYRFGMFYRGKSGKPDV